MTRANEKIKSAQTVEEANNPEETEETQRKLRIGDIDNNSSQEDLERTNFKPLIDQIEREYKLAWDFMKPRWDEWEIRLKLYNNQKRDKEAIGDPLIFTIHQSVLASLYTDTFIAEWEAREEGDEDRAAQLNPLAEYDHDEMEKDVIDYEWDWDTSFFGRGYCLMREFDREATVPVPEVLDPMVCLPDPFAKSVQGNKRGRGSAGFFGWEARDTKREMDMNGNYFNITGLKSGDNTNKLRSPFDRNHDARANAMGTGNIKNETGSLTGDNKGFRVLNWFTFWNGELVFVSLAEDRKKVIRFERIRDKEDRPVQTIPIIDRSLFPISHQLHGVSVPDLVEDKQRARSVLQNVALKSAKNNVYPRYLFNSNKIKNKHDLDVEFNKHIPIDGSPADAVVPAQKDTVKQEVQFILDLLDGAAQRATAVPEFQQGAISDEKRTATEIDIVASRVDKRFNLAARIFGWSEKRFWQQWYRLYKDHFIEDIDEKIVRVTGVQGTQWLPLTRENIIANTDPDVKVRSKIVAESERVRDLQSFRAYITMIAQDPNANIRYAFKELGRLHGINQDKINHLMPKTADEMQAEVENRFLSDEEKTVVLPSDDDMQHLIVHESASDTPQKTAHMNAHKRALLLKKQHPELFQQSNIMNPTNGGRNMGEEMKTLSGGEEDTGGENQNRGGNQPTKTPQFGEDNQ